MLLNNGLILCDSSFGQRNSFSVKKCMLYLVDTHNLGFTMVPIVIFTCDLNFHRTNYSQNILYL